MANLTPDQMEAKLGEQLKRFRLLKNMEQRTLADQAGISVRALRNLEGGHGTTVATLMRVLRALGRESWLDTIAPIPTISPLTMTRTATPRQRARARVVPRRVAAPTEPG